MHMKIHRYDPQKEEKAILPSNKNFRKQDLVFLRAIIILLTVMLLYCVPYELAVTKNILAKTGLLQGVTEARSGGRRFRAIVGLNLQIDGEIYYLPGKYIRWDEYYLSGKVIDEKTTDEVWKIRNLEHKIKSATDQPIAIQYLKYKDYLGHNHLMIVDASSNSSQWIDMEYALSKRKATIWREGLTISLCILVFTALYYFRRNYVLKIKKRTKRRII